MNPDKRRWVHFYSVKTLDALIAMIIRQGPVRLSNSERTLLIDRCQILAGLCRQESSKNWPEGQLVKELNTQKN